MIRERSKVRWCAASSGQGAELGVRTLLAVLSSANDLLCDLVQVTSLLSAAASLSDRQK